ncbi:hypothetical protein FKN01_22540 [Streptomyces sp. 130]|uniref:hypothetical protein n=1 Tax=Streptomyces sp. 130 TaxID=2591006 RepID=UPI00117F7005|nr:hypothetical protein [Streptomyces sp. 130]TRV75196.1 hypothetical protein FKN01_22540 [Streptomyces sp. 130]
MNQGPDDAPHADRDGDPLGLAATAGLFGGGSAGGGVPFGDDGDDGAEDALRRMMHGAVQDLEPSEGSLDRLQRAVPARRARRRQALVGAAAAALLIGTAIPAFVHVANSDGAGTASPAIAGHGEQAQGGNGEEPGADSGNGGGESGGGHPNGGQGLPHSTTTPSDSSGQGQVGDPAGASADPAMSAVDTMRPCDPGQLGVKSARSGAPGADGTVYGAFRIANVSGEDCVVRSGGTVGFEAMGAADPTRIEVVRHTPGDPASGLPDPAAEEDSVLLKPDAVYEVQFAWVPKDTCPSTGGSPSPTPTDGAGGAGGGGSAGSVATGGTGESETGTETQFGADGAAPAEGSISVRHTPEPGAPVAATKIDNACAGTIYRTGVLEPSS